ncbi:MAG TPA: hypothetical protein VFL80_00120 [Thermoanaerobaculia bacterium]|nr:hypothetical protein [Thermoanaerobaculia bacterium]
MFLRWTARGLLILSAAFLALFALDVFSEANGFWRTTGALLMHLIPSIVLLLVLVIAWKRESLGGLLLIGLAALYISSAWGRFPISVYLIVAGPPALAAILFLLNSTMRQRNGTHASV